MANNQKREVELFLSEDSSIKKMKNASKGGRPALEPVISDLMATVDADYNKNQCRQQIGKIAKKVMQKVGYDVIRRKDGSPHDKELNDCSPFGKAATYELTNP